MSKPTAHDLIVQEFKEKSSLKQTICARSGEVFEWFQEVLEDRCNVYKDEMGSVDERVTFEYGSPGRYEARLKFGGDVLVFHLHSNIFKLDEDHPVWKAEYVKADPDRAFVGVINIYNFLSDSIRYNRGNDSGYLVARVFLNKEDHFFVEGKRQLGALYSDFINAKLEKKTVKDIVESAILYALEFDLYVPPYEAMKLVSVAQIQQLTNSPTMRTAKRLGFKFSAEDEE